MRGSADRSGSAGIALNPRFFSRGPACFVQGKARGETSPQMGLVNVYGASPAGKTSRPPAPRPAPRRSSPRGGR